MNNFGTVQRSDGGAIVGEIRAGVFTTAPYGWLLCNGSSFDKGKYPRLAALLPGGYVPDMRETVLSGRKNETLGSVTGSNVMSVPRHTHGVLTALSSGGVDLPINASDKAADAGSYSIPRTVAVMQKGQDAEWIKNATPVYVYDTAAKAGMSATTNVTRTVRTIEEVGDAAADVRGRRCIANFIIRAI